MSFRHVTKYTTASFFRSDTKRQGVLQLATTFSVNPSQSRPLYLSSASDRSWGLRLEGIQGPLSTLPTLKESRKILEAAAREANAGFSQQGVQGGLHTEEAHFSKEDGSSWKGSAEGGSEGSEIVDTACPQGVQGDTGSCKYFSTWLDNCRRYGFHVCDQQLQGIQSGQLTLAEVLADQEARIAEIALNYRKHTRLHPYVQDESLQGTQGQVEQPDLTHADTPCPQGIQGDDCVRFRLWLENCHRFGLHECAEQLQGFQTGRITLSQIFEEQEATIKKVAEQYQRKKKHIPHS